MLTRAKTGILTCSLALSVGQWTACAQEALRDSLAGERAAASRKQSLESQPYNVKAGPVNFLFGAALGVELNDNVNLSETAPQEDLILRPLLNVRAHWPATDKNALNLAVGFSCAKYLKEPRYDRFLIAPDSELSFDIYAGDFRITLFDRFSYTQEPLQQGAVSGSADYGGLGNTAGVAGLWDLNKLLASLTCAHGTFVSASSSFNQMDGSTDQLRARVAFLLNLTTTAGLDAGGGLHRYDQRTLNDNVNFSAGLFYDWKATEYLRVEARAGYVGYRFEQTGQTSLAGDIDGWYASLNFSHRVNEHFSHALEAGREFQAGVYSEVIELIYLRYGPGIKLLRDVVLSPQFVYEHGRQPGALFSEVFDRLGVSLAMGCQLSQKMSGSLGYRFYTKNSSEAGRNYAQSSLSFDFGYRF